MLQDLMESTYNYFADAGVRRLALRFALPAHKGPLFRDAQRALGGVGPFLAFLSKGL